VKEMLEVAELQEDTSRVGEHFFYSSGDPEWFAHLGRRLFGPELSDAQSWIVK
jgi:hypothetical protein